MVASPLPEHTECYAPQSRAGPHSLTPTPLLWFQYVILSLLLGHISSFLLGFVPASSDLPSSFLQATIFLTGSLFMSLSQTGLP